MGKGFGISTKAQLDMASVNQVKKEFTTLIRDLQNLANRNYINIRVNQSSQEMQRFNNQINNTRNNLNNVNNAMNDLNGSNRTFAQQMTHVISKVAQWTLGMTAVYGTIRKVKEGFSFIADIDKKLTDISMITNKSKEELQDYAKSWNDTAIALKTTTDEVVDAEEKYLRAGKSIDEANKMTETNIKLSRIANDTNAQTSEYLVTLSNAYKLNADGVERYANKVAYLDSSTATNTKNINKTAVAVAQTAQETGMSMDFMLGIISTIQEKSKQAPESIGRALRSMLINMQNVTKEGGAELSKLEEILNKRGIALRKNEKEWRSSEDIIKDLMAKWNEFDDISKSAIQSKLAGKVGAEAFNIIMNDQARVMENYNNALNATNTLNEKYEKHLNSAASATAELQARTEKMWLKLIDSNTITNAVKLLTKTVTIIDQLVNHNKLLGIGLVALSVQFVGLIKGVNLFGMALTALKGVGLATFTALATNPLTWIAVAIGGIIALTSHLRNQREETEKLTQEYKDLHKNLTDAMKDNNLQGAKGDIDNLSKKQAELKELIAKRNELQKEMDSANKNGMGIDTNYAVAGDFGKINNRINDLTKALKDAGFVINQTTGDIIELGRAETLLANKEIADNIRKQAEEEIKNRDEIISLINEYQNLNSIQNKNAVQRQRLSQLSEILQTKINGLIVVKDKEGNATIKNTGLLDKEISMLKTEGTTVETLTKVKLESAKQNATIQIGTTKTTYAQVKKRIAMYQEEMKALSSLTNGRMDMLSQKWKSGTITDAERIELDNMQRWGVSGGGRAATNINNLSGYIAEIDRIYADAMNGISLPNYGASEFTPSSDGSDSKKSKEPTKYTFDGKPLDMYEVKLQAINSQLENYDVIMNRIAKNTQKLQDIQSKDAYSEIIDLQIKKLGDLNSKQKVLESQRAELINKRNNGIISELQRFTGNLKNKSVNDIARMNDEDWANLYNKMYGQDVFTGYDEAGQKRQKQYEENAQKFKQLIDNLKNYNKELHTNELAILDVENDINTAIKERIDWQEKLNELTSKDLADISGDIQDKLDLLEIKDKTNYNEKIRLSQELLKAKQDELDFNTKARDSYSQQLKALKEGTLEWSLIKEQVEVYNEKIDESTKNVQQLEKTLESINKEKIDALASIEDEIVSALKNRYEKELELAKEAKAKELLLIENLTDEQKKLLENGSKTRLEIFEEEHEKILKSLNDELKAYEDIYNTKIKEIDRQEDKDSYDKELNKKQQEKAKLQAQYDSLLMDSSLEAQSKRTDLLEQIGLKEDEINEFIHKRDIELRKQNLQDELESKKKAIQDKIDKENEAYKKAKDLYDREVKALEDSNKEKLKSENLYAEARKMLMEGNLDALKLLLEQYGKDSERIFGSLGQTIKKEIVDNLQLAINLMKEFNGASGDLSKWESRDKLATGESVMSKDDVVSKDKEYTINFNKELDESSMQNKIRVVNSNGEEISITTTLSSDKKSIKVVPKSGSYIEGQYQLVVDKGIKDITGNELNNSIIQNFTVGDTADAKSLLEKLIGKKFKVHEKGGLNTSTGWHWLDGTDTKPELILNAKETQAMIGLKDKLPSLLKAIQSPKINLPKFDLPNLSGLGNVPIELKIDRLINIEGNADKSVIPEIKQAGMNTLAELRQALNKQGVRST